MVLIKVASEDVAGMEKRAPRSMQSVCAKVCLKKIRVKVYEQLSVRHENVTLYNWAIVGVHVAWGINFSSTDFPSVFTIKTAGLWRR